MIQSIWSNIQWSKWDITFVQSVRVIIDSTSISLQINRNPRHRLACERLSQPLLTRSLPEPKGSTVRFHFGQVSSTVRADKKTKKKGDREEWMNRKERRTTKERDEVPGKALTCPQLLASSSPRWMGLDASTLRFNSSRSGVEEEEEEEEERRKRRMVHGWKVSSR